MAQRSFNALATRSHQLQRQFGQAAVHLALGVAEFSEQVGDGPVRTVNAPILLRPVRLSTRHRPECVDLGFFHRG